VEVSGWILEIAKKLKRRAGMWALLESPVHESALMYVNKLAGPVWRPPYQVDISKSAELEIW
jgi:hypothetical protein